MGDDAKSLYEREEDKQWRKEVDHKLVTLITSQQVLSDRMGEIEDQSEDTEKIINGNAEKDTAGLMERLHDLEKGVASLRTLMAPDALGHGGIINRLGALELRDRRAMRREEYHWKFWVAIIGMLSATTVAVITNLNRIETAYERLVSGPPSKTSGRAGSARNKTRHRRRIVPAPDAPEDDGASQESLPQ